MLCFIKNFLITLILGSGPCGTFKKRLGYWSCYYTFCHWKMKSYFGAVQNKTGSRPSLGNPGFVTINSEEGVQRKMWIVSWLSNLILIQILQTENPILFISLIHFLKDLFAFWWIQRECGRGGPAWSRCPPPRSGSRSGSRPHSTIKNF